MSAEGDTGLGARFRRLIAATGPISLMHYMGEANARYYASRDPLGAAGDFITAPEISQTFGELLGLWLADMWQRAGSPAPVAYVELGPGRGTLACDALRVMKHVGLEPEVHFVEGSDALRRVQLAAVPQARLHHDLSTLPQDIPILLVANEFLDALPVRQLVMTAKGWRERMVAADGDRFLCVAGELPMDVAVPRDRRDAEEGTIIETCPGAAAAVSEIAARLGAQGGAAVFVDYGHSEMRSGSTLQAVRAHHKVDPFVEPGEADLTAHVDFATLGPLAAASGAAWLGTVPQGDFLRTLGIELRTAALAMAAPARTEEFRAAEERLVAADQMGELFKVMMLAAPGWAPEAKV
jgi:NADH dehydrogenase [ubiquinone] 1 alpha subcomplex assembly factor 7